MRLAATRLGGADVSEDYASLLLKFLFDLTSNFFRTKGPMPRRMNMLLSGAPNFFDQLTKSYTISEINMALVPSSGLNPNIP
jgi:hypothetical protein